MLETIPTAFLFFAVAAVLPGTPRFTRSFWLIALPLLAGWQIWTLPEGTL